MKLSWSTRYRLEVWFFPDYTHVPGIQKPLKFSSSADGSYVKTITEDQLTVRLDQDCKLKSENLLVYQDI